ASYDPLTYYTQGDYEAQSSNLTQPEAIIEELTGAASTTFALPGGLTINDIKTNLALGKWQTVIASGAPGLGIQANQAYAITSVKTGKTGNFITLYNPSGFDKGTTSLGTIPSGKAVDDGLITISETDFFANFVTANVNA